MEELGSKKKPHTTQNRFAALCAHVTIRPYISWHRLRRLTRASGIFPYRLVVVPVDPSHAVDPHLGDPSHLQGHTQHNSVSHRSHTFKHICTKCCSCPIRVLICNNKISQYKTTEKRRNLYMYVCICIYVYMYISFISENESFLHLQQKTSFASYFKDSPNKPRWTSC